MFYNILNIISHLIIANFCKLWVTLIKTITALDYNVSRDPVTIRLNFFCTVTIIMLPLVIVNTVARVALWTLSSSVHTLDAEVIKVTHPNISTPGAVAPSVQISATTVLEDWCTLLLLSSWVILASIGIQPRRLIQYCYMALLAAIDCHCD